MILCFCATAVPLAEAGEPLSGEALVEALRRGGYNIYFRHAATDWSQADRVSVEGDWTSCDPKRMRQLAPWGREVAQRIGEAIRRLEIPIARVFTSEYCRTRETAQAMDLAPVETTPAIMNIRAAAFVGGRDALIGRTRRVLSLPPQPGTNTVFVAHGNLMRAASGAYTVEAGAAVFEPRGEGVFKLVATLAPEDWEQLARDFGHAKQ